MYKLPGYALYCNCNCKTSPLDDWFNKFGIVAEKGEQGAAVLELSQLMATDKENACREARIDELGKYKAYCGGDNDTCIDDRISALIEEASTIMEQ